MNDLSNISASGLTHLFYSRWLPLVYAYHTAVQLITLECTCGVIGSLYHCRHSARGRDTDHGITVTMLMTWRTRLTLMKPTHSTPTLVNSNYDQTSSHSDYSQTVTVDICTNSRSSSSVSDDKNMLHCGSRHAQLHRCYSPGPTASQRHLTVVSTYPDGHNKVCVPREHGESRPRLIKQT